MHVAPQNGFIFTKNAQIWPRHGRDMAATWPRHGRDMAATWPRHGRDMAATCILATFGRFWNFWAQKWRILGGSGTSGHKSGAFGDKSPGFLPVVPQNISFAQIQAPLRAFAPFCLSYPRNCRKRPVLVPAVVCDTFWFPNGPGELTKKHLTRWLRGEQKTLELSSWCLNSIKFLLFPAAPGAVNMCLDFQRNYTWTFVIDTYI